MKPEIIRKVLNRAADKLEQEGLGKSCSVDISVAQVEKVPECRLVSSALAICPEKACPRGCGGLSSARAVCCARGACRAPSPRVYSALEAPRGARRVAAEELRDRLPVPVGVVSLVLKDFRYCSVAVDFHFGDVKQIAADWTAAILPFRRRAGRTRHAGGTRTAPQSAPPDRVADATNEPKRRHPPEKNAHLLIV